MLRRKFPSLSVRFSADLGRVAASLSASFGRGNRVSSATDGKERKACDTKGSGFLDPWRDVNELECDKDRLLILDEDSEDDLVQQGMHEMRSVRHCATQAFM